MDMMVRFTQTFGHVVHSTWHEYMDAQNRSAQIRHLNMYYNMSELQQRNVFLNWQQDHWAGILVH